VANYRISRIEQVVDSPALSPPCVVILEDKDTRTFTTYNLPPLAPRPTENMQDFLCGLEGAGFTPNDFGVACE